MNIIEKLNQLNEMKKGWHFGEGKEISNNIYEIAISLVKHINNLGYSELDCFIGLNGEIMITIYDDEKYVEITINEDERFDYVYQVNNKDVLVQFDIDLDNCLNNLKNI